ncbi:hypothetical protein AB6A40_001882 [Gnathostoma spinigerum]|uniref:Uncharacterized protein n=1 Tax=Gnathostoma spinigerum TaxID=75299 RepID=A0ABD6E589_9BILA
MSERRRQKQVSDGKEDREDNAARVRWKENIGHELRSSAMIIRVRNEKSSLEENDMDDEHVVQEKWLSEGN